MTDVRGRLWRDGKPQDDFEFTAISDYLAEDDALVRCGRTGCNQLARRARSSSSARWWSSSASSVSTPTTSPSASYQTVNPL